MCVLSDHQPANHQEKELSVTREPAVNTEKSNRHCAQPFISEFEGARTQRTSPDSNTVEFDRPNTHCAQSIISQFDDARTQKVSSELNTVVISAEIHAEDTDAQHIVHFEEAEDFSDTGVAVEVLGASTRVGHRICTRASLHVRHTRSLRGR